MTVLDSRLERILEGKPTHHRDAIAASRTLLHTATLLERRIDEVLAPHSLHMSEYLALRLLADSVHEPLRPSDLSASLDATRTQVTRLLDSLQKKGLIVRSQDMQDRRSLQLSLTDAGTFALTQCVPLVQAVYLSTWLSIGLPATSKIHKQLRLVQQRLQSSEFESYTDDYA